MSNPAQELNHIINGVDTNRIVVLATNMSQDQNYGKFRFKADNEWVHGSHSRTSIKDFFAGNNERYERSQPFIVDADQPVFLAGENIAPNAVEHYLNSLISCINTTVVAHSSVQGIHIESLKVSAEGEMDARGFFGVSEDVNRGFNKVKLDIKAKMPVTEEQLQEMMSYSPVYEMVVKAIPVEVSIEMK